jgi:hypothetical protein
VGRRKGRIVLQKFLTPKDAGFGKILHFLFRVKRAAARVFLKNLT